jgi:hypothetical protein
MDNETTIDSGPGWLGSPHEGRETNHADKQSPAWRHLRSRWTTPPRGKPTYRAAPAARCPLIHCIFVTLAVPYARQRA